jgi:hypothetical protein
MLRRTVRTDVSEELGASFIRVTRIGELGTTLAATSNRRTNLTSYAKNGRGKTSFQIQLNPVRFVVFTAVTMKTSQSYLTTDG